MALWQVAIRSKVKGQSSPGTALTAVAADRLTVAVALLDDHADVGLHQLGDVHDLQRRKARVYTVHDVSRLKVGVSCDYLYAFLDTFPTKINESQ